jgi:tRNA(Ile)-lysidine synthase
VWSRAEGRADPAGLADRLLARINDDLPHATRYWVAYSGGLDSTVLLNLLAAHRARLPAPLAAVHVDHGLQPASARWSQHCRTECERLGVPLQSLSVDARPGRGESPEAAARARRYAAIDTLLTPGAMLLTAHHLDDQAETLLLQLLRGAGVAGLAGMPLLRARGDVAWQARPLLDEPRALLRAWAQDRGLSWVEDPSNALQDADRNYLRHRVMPELLARWPAARESIARSAAHCADALELSSLQAQHDLAAVLGDRPGRLRLTPLRGLSAARRRAVVRHWLDANEAPPLPGRRLNEALDQLLSARADAAVRIAWQGWQLRRFRDVAWLLQGSEAPLPAGPVAWQGEELRLPPGLGLLRRVRRPGGIDPRHWQQGRVTVVYRTPGFACRPAGREGTRGLKAIAQEAGIPPWQRPLLPIVLIDGRPAAVANCCSCEPFGVGPGETGWWVEWLPDQA